MASIWSTTSYSLGRARKTRVRYLLDIANFIRKWAVFIALRYSVRLLSHPSDSSLTGWRSVTFFVFLFFTTVFLISVTRFLSSAASTSISSASSSSNSLKDEVLVDLDARCDSSSCWSSLIMSEKDLLSFSISVLIWVSRYYMQLAKAFSQAERVCRVFE